MADSNNSSNTDKHSLEHNRVGRSVEQLMSIRRWSAEFEATLISLEQKLQESEKSASRQRVQYLNAQEEWNLIEKSLKARLEKAEAVSGKLKLQVEDLLEKEGAAIERIRHFEAQGKASLVEKQALENSLKRLTSELNDTRRNLDQELESRRHFEHQVELLKGDLKRQKAHADELNERLLQEGDVSALKKEIRDREKLLQELKSHNDRHTRYLHDLRAAYLEKVETYKNQLTESKNQISTLETRILTLESERLDLQLNSKSLEIEVENSKKNLELKEENQRNQISLEAEKAKLTYERMIQDLEKRSLEQETKIKELEAQLRQEKLRVLKVKEQYKRKPVLKRESSLAKILPGLDS